MDSDILCETLPYYWCLLKLFAEQGINHSVATKKKKGERLSLWTIIPLQEVIEADHYFSAPILGVVGHPHV